MRLTPLDIRKQEFSRGFRGFDAEEVNAFLQMVANQWEELQDENRRREERIRELENKLTHYERVEEALQEALQTARESSRKTLENAEEKASIIIEKAESRAEEITREAEKDRHELKRETVKLSGRRSEIVTRLRAFLMSEMELLARYEGDDPVGFIKLLPAEERKLRRLSERIEEVGEVDPGEGRDKDGGAVAGEDAGAGTETKPRDASLLDEDVAAPDDDLESDSRRGGADRDEETFVEQDSGVPPIESSSAGDSDWTSQSDHGEEPVDSDETTGPLSADEGTEQRREAPPSDSEIYADKREEAQRGWTAETVVSGASGHSSSLSEDDADEESESSRASSEEIEKIRRILSDLD